MSNPRIIAGKAKGIRIKDVPGDITRPITDRVKESLFGIISTDIIDSSFMDLFAGTGSVGIEALSRGASFVRFVDLHHNAIKIIKQNIEITHLSEKAQVIKDDAFSILQKSIDRNFDYIYIAPPQYKEMWEKALRLLDQNPSWLSEDGWIIVQIDPIEYEDLDLANFNEIDKRYYGNTLLVIFMHSHASLK